MSLGSFKLPVFDNRRVPILIAGGIVLLLVVIAVLVAGLLPRNVLQTTVSQLGASSGGQVSIGLPAISGGLGEGVQTSDGCLPRFEEVSAPTLARSSAGHDAIVYAGKIFRIGTWMATDDQGSSSADGINWVRLNPNKRFVFPNLEVFQNKLWVIGGLYANRVHSSTDGINWTQENVQIPGTTLFPYSNRGSFVFNGKVWIVAVGPSSASRIIYSSSDGITWNRVSDVPYPIGSSSGGTDIALYNGRVWSVGGYGHSQVFATSDGSNWAPVGNVPGPSGVRLSDHETIAFDGKLWVIGGVFDTPPYGQGNYDYTRKVFTSTNGSNWQEVGNNALPYWLRYHRPVVLNGQLWLIPGVSHYGVGTTGKVYRFAPCVDTSPTPSPPSTPTPPVTPTPADPCDDNPLIFTVVPQQVVRGQNITITYSVPTGCSESRRIALYFGYQLIRQQGVSGSGNLQWAMDYDPESYQVRYERLRNGQWTLIGGYQIVVVGASTPSPPVGSPSPSPVGSYSVHISPPHVPVGGSINFSYTAPSAGTRKVELRRVSGALVAFRTVNGASGSGSFYNLNQGSYRAKLVREDTFPPTVLATSPETVHVGGAGSYQTSSQQQYQQLQQPQEPQRSFWAFLRNFLLGAR